MGQKRVRETVGREGGKEGRKGREGKTRREGGTEGGWVQLPGLGCHAPNFGMWGTTCQEKPDELLKVAEEQLPGHAP